MPLQPCSGRDDGAVLDRMMFDDFASLFDERELRDVIEQWHADSENALDELAEAVAHDDRERIGSIAHRAAGGGLALGAATFARACERLRAAAESGAAVSESDVEPVRAAVATTYAAMQRAAADVAARHE